MQAIELKQFQELRFEGLEVKIFVTEGIVEYLGQELLNERWYVFKNTKGYFYTITGAKLKIEGRLDIFYISKHTNLKHIFKYFYKKHKSNKHTENILVIGKGRSTFTTTIINLFLRNKFKTVLTELSPDTGNLVFSGVLGISLIDKLIEYNKGIDLNNSLIYFYGSNKEEEYFSQYQLIIKEIFNKLKNNKNIKDKIKNNTFNFIIGPNNLEIINLIKEELNIDEIIVLGDERLFNLVEGNKIFIPNSGYLPTNKLKIREYFYGRNEELTPYNLYTKNFYCFTWSNEVVAPTSALPLGAERKLVVNNFEEVETENNYVYAIMEGKGIKPCLGFVVPLEGNRLLAPKNKIMKDIVLFKGGFKYYEN